MCPACMLTTLALAAALLWAPARADNLVEVDGEPTDPDQAIALLGEAGIDPQDSGLSATIPQTEAEAEAWWNAILDLLMELIEGGGSGK
jgi:hypothetical protein